MKLATLEKPVIGKGGMASCSFNKKIKAWACQVGDTKFKTKNLEIEPTYRPNAIGVVTYDYKGANYGELYLTGYALGHVKCETLYGKPVKGVYGKAICRILPLPPKEREAYLKGYGK